jgi:two-component system cell cycle sensor histidine kinase/response regulator CckA
LREDSHTILVVDDEPINLRLLSEYLKESGCRMLVARSGQSALEKARYGKPDLILLDVMMPGLDGFETCRRLKANEALRDIPVIFMSSLTRTEDKVKGFQVGAVDYITKPFQHEEVLARLVMHLRLRDLTRELQEAKRTLEKRVEKRTAELAQTNKELLAEIAERRRAEEAKDKALAETLQMTHALRESEKKWRLLYENLPGGSFVVNDQFIIEDVNDVLCKLTGFAKEELIGRSCDIICPKGPHRCPILDLKKERIDNDETAIKVKDGQLVPVIKSARRIPIDEKEVVVENFQDITERKQVEEEKEKLQAQMSQAQKMEALGQLAGGIAHDFNNLLTIIQLNTQLMERQLSARDPLEEHVREIAGTSKRAAKLVRQLLSFGRRQIVEPRLLNLNDVICDLTPMLRRIIGGKIELQISSIEDLWLVKADPSQMEQVIVNLVVNARDAMPQGGTLTVRTGNVVLDETHAALHVEVQLGKHVLLVISDTGVGMSAEVKSHIFEPFFTTKEPGQGTGLGLATVFGIVKQNGGYIQVHSQVGQGTTFEIYLPYAS